MLDLKISRRLFIGATTCIVTAPLLGKEYNKVNNINVVIENGQFFDADELTVLTDIAEIMIPKTDTIGATDAHVIILLDGLMLTWAATNTKKQYRSVIKEIKTLANDSYGGVYKTLPLAHRTELIEQVDINAFNNKKSTLSVNYRRLKEMIFHVYYTSEPVNPDFRLIPGGYRGCLTKDELTKIQERGYL